MKKHYFLLAALVVYQRDKLERQKPLNVLIPSDTATVNRSQLGRAQQQAQVRFFTEFDRERKSEVVDVFVQSVSYLGEMTEKEFRLWADCVPEEDNLGWDVDLLHGEPGSPFQRTLKMGPLATRPASCLIQQAEWAASMS